MLQSFQTPITILSEVPSDNVCFTVIGLANAFFSIPVHPDSQPWFAFTFKGKRWTWAGMPRGFVESPAVFSAELGRNLEQFVPPEGSALIQHVADLLSRSPSQQARETDSKALLLFLSDNGHEVSREKLQLCSPEVTYLGQVIAPDGRRTEL